MSVVFKCKPIEVIRRKTKSIVLSKPDMHLPFEHRDAFQFLKAVKEYFKPTKVVNLGDFSDWHGISFHDKDPDGYSAGHEYQEVLKRAQPYFKLFPETYVCDSNHGSLPYRKAFAHGLPSALMKSNRDILQAPKDWHWADQWEFDGVLYEHGDPFSGAQAALKCAEQNMQSTVIGHVHSFAGIQYSANSKHLIFGFNVGCLIDKDAYAFAYAKKIKRKPIIGCGIITDGIPQFIPMRINASGRWVGRI